jgi:hypothetical protein
MNKIFVEYLDENNNIVFSAKPKIHQFIERTGDVVIWLKQRFLITLIEHNYDENKITILVKQQ